VIRCKVGADADVNNIDVIGLYEDFNWEGDGRYRQWHYRYHYGRMQSHIGTATASPWNSDLGQYLGAHPQMICPLMLVQCLREDFTALYPIEHWRVLEKRLAAKIWMTSVVFHLGIMLLRQPLSALFSRLAK